MVFTDKATEISDVSCDRIDERYAPTSPSLPIPYTVRHPVSASAGTLAPIHTLCVSQISALISVFAFWLVVAPGADRGGWSWCLFDIRCCGLLCVRASRVDRVVRSCVCGVRSSLVLSIVCAIGPPQHPVQRRPGGSGVGVADWWSSINVPVKRATALVRRDQCSSVPRPRFHKAERPASPDHPCSTGGANLLSLVVDPASPADRHLKDPRRLHTSKSLCNAHIDA